jgi:hypothetical protein
LCGSWFTGSWMHSVDISSVAIFACETAHWNCLRQPPALSFRSFSHLAMPDLCSNEENFVVFVDLLTLARSPPWVFCTCYWLAVLRVMKLCVIASVSSFRWRFLWHSVCWLDV